jgi:hypothetical protein
MKKDKAHVPSRNPDSEQLAHLRSKQEWHEGLARKHAASAKRVWLRRILLELSHERQEGDAGTRKRSGSQAHSEK